MLEELIQHIESESASDYNSVRCCAAVAANVANRDYLVTNENSNVVATVLEVVFIDQYFNGKGFGRGVVDGRGRSMLFKLGQNV